jgi:hypothetical protein
MLWSPFLVTVVSGALKKLFFRRKVELANNLDVVAFAVVLDVGELFV